jgi:hypothetical protein
MENTDPRVDAYIENGPDFAQPILMKLRKAFHAGEPDVEETMIDPAGLFGDVRKNIPMSIKIMDPKELPTQKVLTGYVKQAVEWMATGKSRNWKYTNC